MDVNVSTRLAPHHYIKFDNTGAFKGMSLQKQRILVIDNRPKLKLSPKPITKDEAGAEQVRQEEDKVIDKLLSGIEHKKIVYDPKALSIPEEAFTQIVLLSYDKDVIGKIKAVLEKRWSNEQQLDGILFVAGRTDSLYAEFNSPYICLIPLKHAVDSAALWGVSFAVMNANYASEPARPYQNLKLPGITSAASEGFTLAEREELLGKGFSSWRKAGDDIMVDRLITTFLKSVAGADDPSYRDLNTLQTLSLLRYDFRSSVALRYPRHMLAKDGYQYKGPVVTPKMLRSFCITKYRQWQENSLVQDEVGMFKKRLSVEVDKNTPGKVNITLPIQVMGQWRITDTTISFEL